MTAELKAAEAMIAEMMFTEHQQRPVPFSPNPLLLTELIHKLGVDESIVVKNVATLNRNWDSTQGTTPEPILALVLAMPPNDWYVNQSGKKETLWPGPANQEDVVFLPRTIFNAGGLNAILHAVINGCKDTALLGEFSMPTGCHRAMNPVI
jgi:hypothetical protein